MRETITITYKGNTAIVQPFPHVAATTATAHVQERQQIPWEQLQRMTPSERRNAQLTTKHVQLFKAPLHPEGHPEEGEPTGKWGLIFAGLVPRVAEALRRARHPVVITNEPKYPRVSLDHLPVDWRPKQKESLEEMLSSARGTLKAAAGWGKSELVCIACKLLENERILLINTTRPLLSQIAERLKRVGSDKVYMNDCQHKPNYSDAKVISSSVKSLHHVPADWPTVIIYDEVHTAGADTAVVQLSRFQKARMFGMSATPFNRTDGGNLIVEALFGPMITEVTPQDAEDFGATLPVRIRRVQFNPGTQTDWTTRNAMERYGLWANWQRNNLVADCVRALQKEGFPQIMITVTTAEHGLRLRQLLPEFTLVHGGFDKERFEYFKKQNLVRDDEVMKPDLQKLATDFREQRVQWVIATKGWWTGVDFPKLTCVIRADGVANRIAAEQIGGRLTRVSDGKEFGTMVDFIDMHNNDLYRASMGRMRHYNAIGWRVDAWQPPKVEVHEVFT